MHRHAASRRSRFRVQRKSDAPRHIGCLAVAAAVHQAAKPAKHITERHTWSDGIPKLPKRKLLEVEIDDYSNAGPNESPVKDQPAMLHHENFPAGLPSKRFLPIRNYVK